MKKLVLALLCGTIALSPVVNANETTEKSEDVKIEEKVFKDTKLSLELSKEDLKKVNKYLKDSLKESHDFATEGNSVYDLYLYLIEVKFIEDGRLIVQVEPDFVSLSEDDKSSLVNVTKGMGQLALLLELKDEEAITRDIFLSFRNGPEIIGSSKLSGDGVKWKQ